MDHVELINRIIEAEQQAQQMAQEARDKKTHLQEDLIRNSSAMRENYFEQAKNRVAIVREREVKTTTEKLEALDALSSMELEAMRTMFDNNRAEWVDTIFSRIVGS